MRKHRVHLCDKCDFQCTVRYDLVRHRKIAHRINCPGCKIDLPSNIRPEDHQCPKILGPGKPSQEELEKLNLLKTDRSFVKKISGGNYICLECGLCNSQKQFMMTHIQVGLDILYCIQFFLFSYFFRSATVTSNVRSVILQQPGDAHYLCTLKTSMESLL